jgi:hypothetical protein
MSSLREMREEGWSIYDAASVVKTGLSLLDHADRSEAISAYLRGLALAE